MNESILKAASDHALAEYPREACGLVIVRNGRQIYRRCINRATSPEDHFVIDANDFAIAEDAGEIVALVHSHPDGRARPSEADRVSCEASGLKWTILSVMPGEEGPYVAEVFELEPEGYEAPLVGRPFHHGVLDCYSVVRDWYARERGIALPNFERRDGWWDDGHSNLYLDHFREAGFEPVGQYPKDLEAGDVILMQIRSRNRVPNHAAVYLGDGRMLHHMAGRLSSVDVYGGMWREATILVVRRGAGS